MQSHLARFHAFVLAVALACASLSADGERTFAGSWCVSGEGLVITFFSADSLHVKSLHDESISGAGVYTLSDSLLHASIENEDLALEMGYRYAWQADTLVRAKIMFFKVNGDSVNHPRQWLRMSKCESARTGAAAPDDTAGEKAAASENTSPTSAHSSQEAQAVKSE